MGFCRGSFFFTVLVFGLRRIGASSAETVSYAMGFASAGGFLFPHHWFLAPPVYICKMKGSRPKLYRMRWISGVLFSFFIYVVLGSHGKEACFQSKLNLLRFFRLETCFLLSVPTSIPHSPGTLLEKQNWSVQLQLSAKFRLNSRSTPETLIWVIK